MRGVLALALLAAGCAAAGGPGPDPAPTPSASAEGFDLRIECDRARIVVPERLRAAFVQRCNLPPYEVTVGAMEILVREDVPRVEVAGEDLSVVAEGSVRLTRREGRLVYEEGPFRTVILRNDRILRR